MPGVPVMPVMPPVEVSPNGWLPISGRSIVAVLAKLPGCG